MPGYEEGIDIAIRENNKRGINQEDGGGVIGTFLLFLS
jgi:hypothetical protein